MGVWIETDQMAAQFGIKAVTPCVGVWIETALASMAQARAAMSHPAWVCGLKLSMDAIRSFINVTPCVGVWIETLAPVILRKKRLRHTLRGCVD